MEILTKRIGIVRENGGTLSLSLREEFFDLGLDIGKSVFIIVTKDKNGEKVITIEKINSDK